MAKALFFLRATDGTGAELLARVKADANRIFRDLPDGHVALRVMEKLADDPLCNRQAPEHLADVTVEIKTTPGLPLHAATTAWRQKFSRELVDRERSLALVMHQRVFRPAEPQPLVYHYLMVRAPGLLPADYHDYYVNCHSHFGMVTPGIEGYSQNYIDHVGSQQVAAVLEFGFREVTSISELAIADMDTFLSSTAMAEVGPAAAEDEGRFVEREASIMFTSRVVLTLGEQAAVGKSYFA